MRKYLWLLVAPLLLTGCFNDEPKVAAPVDEAAVVEDVNTENEAQIAALAEELCK